MVRVRVIGLGSDQSGSSGRSDRSDTSERLGLGVGLGPGLGLGLDRHLPGRVPRTGAPRDLALSSPLPLAS
eukprot:scaffold133030_cov18-Phaeocystis_antarctica.AAC.1